MRLLLAAAATVLSLAAAVQAQVAFPGAVGAGAVSIGGRGGTVCRVTNLADTGTGSLRTCLASGNRTVVFRVAGTITLASQINVSSSNITIAGHTAPGGGIQLRFNTTSATRDVLRFTGSNVTVRHLRIRRGPGASSGTAPIEGDNLEFRCRDCIADHMSLYWSTDQLANAGSTTDGVTFQRSLMAEALNNSTNPERPHGMGPLFYNSRDVTLHQTLMASNLERAPRINTMGIVDVTNNVIYNYRNTPTTITSDFGSVSVNYVSNFIKTGPSGPSGTFTVYCAPTSNSVGVYRSGNLKNSGPHEPVQQSTCRRGTRYPSATYPLLADAGAAYNWVLANSGAWPRDPVDQRVVAYVQNGGGAIIDNPSQVGGWPTLATAAAPQDVDADGMPVEYEAANGLSDTNAADRNTVVATAGPCQGYTNLECYLHKRHQELVPYE